MKRRFCFCFLLLSAVSQANQVPGNPTLPGEAQDPIDTEQEPRTSPSPPQPGEEGQQKPNSEPLQRFIPKERIPAASAISFPTDI